MLGIEDPWIWSGYVTAFAAVVFCVIYGWMKRNEGDV